jgi:hypothetical protein
MRDEESFNSTHSWIVFVSISWRLIAWSGFGNVIAGARVIYLLGWWGFFCFGGWGIGKVVLGSVE